MLPHTRRRFLSLLLPLLLVLWVAFPALAQPIGVDPDGEVEQTGRFVTSWVIEENVVHLTTIMHDLEDGYYRRTLTVRLADGKVTSATDLAFFSEGTPVSGSFVFPSDVELVLEVSFIKETFDP